MLTTDKLPLPDFFAVENIHRGARNLAKIHANMGTPWGTFVAVALHMRHHAPVRPKTMTLESLFEAALEKRPEPVWFVEAVSPHLRERLLGMVEASLHCILADCEELRGYQEWAEMFDSLCERREMMQACIQLMQDTPEYAIARETAREIDGVIEMSFGMSRPYPSATDFMISAASLGDGWWIPEFPGGEVIPFDF
ncbi:MAG: hypothetical protein OEY01_03370 [Desulfobulbaceae bacterium]|nr:hypothetical protein [Desulfobulbaceae bacterium]